MNTTTATATSEVVTRPPERHPFRRAGWFGLAGSVAYLTTGVLANSGAAVDEPDSVADVGRYLDEIDAVTGTHVAYGLAGVALCLLFVPMARATTGLLGGTANARRGTLALIAGLLALIPAYLMNIVASAGVVALSERTDLTDARLLDVLDAAALVSTVSFAVGSFLSLGVGPFLWARAAGGNRAVPRWLGRLFVVVGVTGAVWLLPTGGLLFVPLMVNVLGSLVAYTALSVVLVRRSS